MSHMVLKNIVDEISKSPFIAIIADSKTDISGEEQFSLCVCCVSPGSLEIKEFFVGMYNPPDSAVIVLMAWPICRVSGMVYRNTSLKNFLKAVLYIFQTMLLISLYKKLQ
ncbi:hypothetical protein PR048_011225 [Dryococelus australis]|uniref:Uncharacterized protein n=1 Tax=Dryococelus australis TaxID=614101 RepID=A0ABQ9HL12_9NEOP|nr:hypothetical protein PR048_011225 [Dryococelus australis]